ncbi:YppG family protein [Bacillus sp. EB01]|uniref:YppG family protein n=1 Tax=Bacillus sp. EB01 TaxID=1347086 RepID=UPI0006943771|nr:YppG family protein [Bacillus sp. EB01]
MQYNRYQAPVYGQVPFTQQMPYGVYHQQGMPASHVMPGFQPGFPVGENMWPNNQFVPQTQQNRPGSHFLFQNPLDPGGQNGFFGNSQPMQQMGFPPQFNPYPKGQFVQKTPGAMQSILGSFKSQDGTLDINKMVNTAGQMVSTVSQASALLKGLGGVFKA